MTLATDLHDLRRATVALALELPASVHEDYSRRLSLVLAHLEPEAGGSLTADECALVVQTLLGEAIVYDYNAETEDAARLRSAAKKLLKHDDLTHK